MGAGSPTLVWSEPELSIGPAAVELKRWNMPPNQKLGLLESTLAGMVRPVIGVTVAFWAKAALPHNAAANTALEYFTLVRTPGRAIRFTIHRMDPIEIIDGSI